MEVQFSTREDGQVDASLGPDWPLFNHALGDSVSSLPPRGEPGNAPSTYWVDVAATGARRAAERGDGNPFTWGNITTLHVEGDDVVARYDYDEEGDGERVPLNEFLELLEEWRERVLASRAGADASLPDTYRRNPLR